MTYQNDLRASPTLSKYGCYVASLYYYRIKMGKETSIDELNAFWKQAIEKGFIDSNYDIKNPQAIVDMMGLPLKYRDAHYPANSPLEPNVFTILCLYRPSNKFTHFVVGTDIGHIEFDPIYPHSLTAAASETYVKSLRLYDIV